MRVYKYFMKQHQEHIQHRKHIKRALQKLCYPLLTNILKVNFFAAIGHKGHRHLGTID